MIFVGEINSIFSYRSLQADNLSNAMRMRAKDNVGFRAGLHNFYLFFYRDYTTSICHYWPVYVRHRRRLKKCRKSFYIFLENSSNVDNSLQNCSLQKCLRNFFGKTYFAELPSAITRPYTYGADEEKTFCFYRRRRL